VDKKEGGKVDGGRFLKKNLKLGTGGIKGIKKHHGLEKGNPVQNQERSPLGCENHGTGGKKSHQN